VVADSRPARAPSPNVNASRDVYEVGMRIRHERFGAGIVRKVEGKGAETRVTVIFDAGSERKFLVHYAPMRPL
jgi:DNA helicase-2/ATP-dependent DNA helicase PcrA